MMKGQDFYVVVWAGLFSIRIPEGWIHETEDGVIAIFDPDGAGVLQLSFAKRSKHAAPDSREAINLAERYLQQKNWSALILAQEIGSAPASHFSYEDRATDSHWRVWHIVGDKQAAFVT